MRAITTGLSLVGVTLKSWPRSSSALLSSTTNRSSRSARLATEAYRPHMPACHANGRLQRFRRNHSLPSTNALWGQVQHAQVEAEPDAASPTAAQHLRK